MRCDAKAAPDRRYRPVAAGAALVVNLSHHLQTECGLDIAHLEGGAATVAHHDAGDTHARLNCYQHRPGGCDGGQIGRHHNDGGGSAGEGCLARVRLVTA